MTVPTDFTCNAALTLCIKSMSATTYHNAVSECTALGARMCQHVDMMELCGEMNPFSASSSGMYGDKATNDDWHGTWNRNWCDTNNDLAITGN